jgi:hypothetical protein
MLLLFLRLLLVVRLLRELSESEKWNCYDGLREGKGYGSFFC